VKETAMRERVAVLRALTYQDLTVVAAIRQHNFCVMARKLRLVENDFCILCGFNELRVVKIPHISTSTLYASVRRGCNDASIAPAAVQHQGTGRRAAGVGPEKVDASAIPVMAFSVGKHELLGLDAKFLAGHLAAWNYFHSVKSPENEAFIKMRKKFTGGKDEITNDPMEAIFIGFRMWAQAAAQAGTTDVDAVRQAMYGQRVKAPSGFEEVMNTNHHLSKPAMIGKIDSRSSGSQSTRSGAMPGASTFQTVPNVLPIGPFPGSAGGCVEPTYKDW
jgi:hypothetical protein